MTRFMAAVLAATVWATAADAAPVKVEGSFSLTNTLGYTPDPFELSFEELFDVPDLTVGTDLEQVPDSISPNPLLIGSTLFNAADLRVRLSVDPSIGATIVIVFAAPDAISTNTDDFRATAGSFGLPGNTPLILPFFDGSFANVGGQGIAETDPPFGSPTAFISGSATVSVVPLPAAGPLGQTREP